MIQLKNRYVAIELINNATAIALSWQGYVPGGLYRETLEKALEIAKSQGIKNWLSDIRLMRMPDPADREWAKSVWIPKAVAANAYEKQAVIMPEDIFAGASARNMLAIVQDQHVETKYFSSPEEAKAWLLSQDKPQ